MFLLNFDLLCSTCENSLWNNKVINLHVIFVSFCAFTSEVQIIGGVDDNPHQGEVESCHLGSDLELDTAMVQVVGAQQAVDGIDGLSLYFSPVKTFLINV